jgi:hypothetical protein
VSSVKSRGVISAPSIPDLVSTKGRLSSPGTKAQTSRINSRVSLLHIGNGDGDRIESVLVSLDKVQEQAFDLALDIWAIVYWNPKSFNLDSGGVSLRII